MSDIKRLGLRLENVTVSHRSHESTDSDELAGTDGSSQGGLGPGARTEVDREPENLARIVTCRQCG
jgi:hypothetical protein